MNQASLNEQIDVMVSDCIAVRVRRINRVITAIFDRALRPLDMKTSQLNLLVVTARLGIARPAVVCQALQMDASTISRNVERMRLRGWLEIVDDDLDARAQPFQLTTVGRRLLQKAIPAWHEAQQQAINLLGDDGVRVLKGLTMVTADT